MNATAYTVKSGVAEGGDHEIFSKINEPATSLVVWKRPLSPQIKQCAEIARGLQLDYAGDVDTTNESHCDRLRMDVTTLSPSLLKPLTDDLIKLASAVEEISGAIPERMRLETIADDGCRLFHVDNVFMRLVIAYAGAGTQWVPPPFEAAARAQQTDYDGPLEAIETGDVALFRGRRSDGARMTLHRSPPFRPGSRPRVIGVVDFAGV